MYDRLEEARMRLSSSLIRLDGEAFFIDRVYRTDYDPDDEDLDHEEVEAETVGPGNIYVSGTLTGYNSFVTDIPLDSARLDFRPVPLGFRNQPRAELCYMQRQPYRSYKQGLTAHNYDANDARTPSFTSTDMAATIKGEYPCLTNILDLVESEPRIYGNLYHPFAREWAIRVDATTGVVYVFYGPLRSCVGESLDGGSTYTVYPQYAHLLESLTEAASTNTTEQFEVTTNAA